jgi:Zn-dependent protease with chaperone function
MSYVVLLACVLAASAALGYAAAALAVRWLAAARASETLTGARALVLRVLPGGCALLLSLGLALPAFLRYEPDQTEARPGATAVVVGLAGILLLQSALRRGLNAWRATVRLAREWHGMAEPLAIPAPVPTFALDHPFPVVAVVGIWQPRLYLARQVIEALTAEEIEAVLAHESGHVSARDNLKRLLLCFLPTVGWQRLARGLEERWEAESEAVADRSAGPAAALELASALVKVARLAPAGARLGLPVAAFHTGDGVATRVQALMAIAEDAAPRRRPHAHLVLLAATLAALAAAAVLPVVHGLSEALIHLP